MMDRFGVLVLVLLLAVPAAAADLQDDAVAQFLQQRKWLKIEPQSPSENRFDQTPKPVWSELGSAYHPLADVFPAPSAPASTFPSWPQTTTLPPPAVPTSRSDPTAIAPTSPPSPPAWRESPPGFGTPRRDLDTTLLNSAPPSSSSSALPSWVRLPNQAESAALAVGSYQTFKLSRLESVGALNAELIAKGVETSLAERSAPYLFRLLSTRGVAATTLGVAVTAGGIFVYDWFVGDDQKKDAKK